MRLEDCCTHCVVCGHSYCRDENPTPGDAEKVCPDCYVPEVTC